MWKFQLSKWENSFWNFGTLVFGPLYYLGFGICNLKIYAIWRLKFGILKGALPNLSFHFPDSASRAK